MITELLASILFQSNFSTRIDSSLFNRSEIVVERKLPEKPAISRRQVNNQTPTPTNTPTPTPKPSKTPKATSKPKVFPAVKSAQTSNITTQNVLNALNNYRAKNGAGALQIDKTLQNYAQSRADHLKSLGKLDKHAGHKEFMRNDGFSKLGFNAIAENQSWNYTGDAVGLIENLYGKSSGHNKNQLNSEYTHVGIGINGLFTNLVFGGKKK